MATTITRKGETAFSIAFCLIVGLNTVSCFKDGKNLMVIFGSALIIWQLIWAMRNYRQVWEITKDGKIFKVVRNNKVLFEGRSMDLASVTTDFGNYFLDPLNGRMIKVPRTVANDAFLDLIKSRDGDVSIP